MEKIREIRVMKKDGCNSQSRVVCILKTVIYTLLSYNILKLYYTYGYSQELIFSLLTLNFKLRKRL